VPDATDEKRLLNENRRLWNEWTAIHTRSEFYDVESFVDGTRPVRIEPWEQAEVGDVRGKSLLHLQCHFGLDTLSWARLGATVTGVDFSEKAIEAARDLARRVGIEARFVLSTVYELGDVLDEEFDVVYASRGALGWLPSIERWAGVAARYVRPGGFLYLHEGHPVLWTFDETQTHSNPVRLAYGYWEGDVITTRPEGSYADRAAQVEAQAEHGWNHGLGEVVTALAKRGLHIEFLHEQDFLSWPESFLTRAEDGRYRWPADQAGTLPLMYSLKASRPRER
jgi:SAM-dependent methyltransferase